MKKLLFIPIVVFVFQTASLMAQELVMITPKASNAMKEEAVSLNASAPAVSSFEFDIYSKADNSKSIAPELIGSHFLGQEIAKKMYLLDQTYTFETKIAPGNPATTTSIRKPAIYNSVKKVESYLKKSIRKKEISTEKATAEFNKVIDVAINILFQNTEAFENQIKVLDHPSELLSLYTERVRLNFMN